MELCRKIFPQARHDGRLEGAQGVDDLTQATRQLLPHPADSKELAVSVIVKFSHGTRATPGTLSASFAAWLDTVTQGLDAMQDVRSRTGIVRGTVGVIDTRASRT